MDVKVESTRKTGFLWKLLNEILAEITGKLHFHFNLKSRIVGDHGANFFSVGEVFSVNVVMSRVVSCQMHYKRDLNKASAKVGGVS